MKKSEDSIITLLEKLLRQRKRKPSHLAAELGISHATVSRWFSGKDIPSTNSCKKIADYSGIPIEKILYAAGHIPGISSKNSAEWPEFREYIREKYPNEIDEDLVTMIEDLIERNRERSFQRNKKKNSNRTP